MTLKTSEFWVTEPFDDILRKIQLHTKEVKFGWFNVFNTKHEKFNKSWIGQVDKKTGSFKLFRVTAPEHTSDLSVNGMYTTRLNKPLVIVQHKIHFTALLGLFGVLVCAYAIWYLLRNKGVIQSELFLFGELLLVGIYYAITISRDLNKNEKEIERVIYMVLKEDKDDEGEDDDEEPED